MKIKACYKLRTVAGENMVVSAANDPDAFKGVIMLNDTGAFLWKLLENGSEKDEMVKALIAEYDIDEETASKAADSFIEQVTTAKVCE